jgi:hypothetical protein
MKAKTMARQKGRKACRNRRQVQYNVSSAAETARAAQQGASREPYDGANMTSHTVKRPAPSSDAQIMKSRHELIAS